MTTSNKIKISQMTLEQAFKFKKKYLELLRITKPSNRMVSIGTDTDPLKRQKWERKLDMINNRISQLTTNI